MMFRKRVQTRNTNMRLISIEITDKVKQPNEFPKDGH